MRRITTVRFLIAVLIAAAVGGLANRPGARAASALERLTPATFAAIKGRIALTPEELAWQRIPWRDGFFRGLMEAQAADEPLFYRLDAGDPRGDC